MRWITYVLVVTGAAGCVESRLAAEAKPTVRALSHDTSDGMLTVVLDIKSDASVDVWVRESVGLCYYHSYETEGGGHMSGYGLCNSKWRESVRLPPGESVRLEARFAEKPSKYWDTMEFYVRYSVAPDGRRFFAERAVIHRNPAQPPDGPDAARDSGGREQ